LVPEAAASFSRTNKRSPPTVTTVTQTLTATFQGSADELGRAIGLSGSTDRKQLLPDQRAGSGAVESGNQLSLGLSNTVQPPFAGPRVIWGAAQKNGAQTSPWAVLRAWLAAP
jgi:hypothetical protein